MACGLFRMDQSALGTGDDTFGCARVFINLRLSGNYSGNLIELTEIAVHILMVEDDPAIAANLYDFSGGTRS